MKLNGDLRFNGQEKLVNNKQNDSMPTEIRKVLDGVWDKTINDAKSLQFLMVYKGICYLCNAYPFLNESKEVIGAICFLRNIDLIQNAPRLSVDRSNMMDCPLPLPREHLATLLENKPPFHVEK